MMRGMLVGEDRRKYILAGNATTTIVNPATRNRFTYKVKAPRKQKDATIRFVSVLRGADNTSDFQYIGYIRADGTFMYGGERASVSPDAPSMKAFKWFWHHAEDPRVEVFHEGRCGRCGRKLTVPESVTNGLGPECSGKVM
jgi:hypothetical protein